MIGGVEAGDRKWWGCRRQEAAFPAGEAAMVGRRRRGGEEGRETEGSHVCGD